MSENTRDAMTAGIPMEIWARDFDAPQYKGEFFKYEPNNALAIKYHHDDKYRALEAEVERFREAIIDLVDGEDAGDLQASTGLEYERCVEIRQLFEQIMKGK